MDTAVTDHLLTTTRAVRKRLDLDRPVEPDVILECLRLAIQAPTGSNSQGWRWMVVTDPDKKVKLARLYEEGGGDYLRKNATAAGAQGRVYSSAAYLLDVLHRVPAMVIPCIEGRVDGASNGQAAGFYGSILPAVWSFQLALRSRGLGSAWTSLHLHKEKEAAELLGIPDNISQVALLPVAYTIGDDFKPAVRRPVEEITFWDSWGHTR
ncbi:nitroreductase family protein [Acidiferrimicrobium sp. IK]|uniref:nitroreductase family protein n=1 Tax=Acidiferrimicrobium sp. IK TaxID=2871700 RepID=UPI0021CB8487|nr:nitroreductase family protein [Acidiferrimicrobium sp. IK]MCU4185983.1 nitroreductase family protein [Acidiferrimicrobium sp. IK]